MGAALSAGNLTVVGHNGTDYQQTGPIGLPLYFVSANPIVLIDPVVDLGFGFTFVGQISPAAAPALGVGPTKLSFPTARVGATVGLCLADSVCRALKIQNIGTSDLTGLAVTTSGDFSETNTCSSSLSAGGAYCTVSVMFSPTALGYRSGSVQIASNATSSPFTVPLTGSGGLPAVQLSSGSLAFQATDVGKSSQPQTVTITDTGTWALAISHIDISGDFTETTNCAANLAVRSSCIITVTFLPTVTGPRTGSLSITDDAVGTPHVVSLSGGGGSAIALSAKSTDLTVNAGQSAIFTVNVTSPAGTNGAVAFSCSGAPPSGSCMVAPPSATLNGTNSIPITVTVATAARSMAMIQSTWRELPFYGFAAVGIPLLLLHRRQVWRYAAIALASLVFASCGGGGSTPPNKTTFGTPAGKYTVTVTASNSTSSESMPLSVTVN